MRDFVENNHCALQRNMEEVLNISKEVIQTILAMIWAKLKSVLNLFHTLTNEQNSKRCAYCTVIIHNAENDAKLYK